MSGRFMGYALHMGLTAKLVGGDRDDLVPFGFQRKPTPSVFGNLLGREVFAVGIVLNGETRRAIDEVGRYGVLKGNGASVTAEC